MQNAFDECGRAQPTARTPQISEAPVATRARVDHAGAVTRSAEVPPVSRWLRPALFVLLAGSALAAIGLEPLLVRRVGRGDLPATVLFAPVAVYAAFLLLYAADRWLLVQRRRYPSGRAFFQVVVAVFFGLLLLPSTLHEWAEARPREASLARHPQAQVRAVYVEALGFRGPSAERVAEVSSALEDPDPDVEAAARRVLAAWSSLSPADTDALAAWAERFLRARSAAGDDP